MISITRLAVDKTEYSKSIGRSLLADALLKIIQVSNTVDIRGILVYAKNQEAKDFYLKYGFEASLIDEFPVGVLKQ